MALKWDGKKAVKYIDLTMQQRLDAAAMTWVKYTQRKLNEKVNSDGKTPSKKGDKYPAYTDGHLRDSIDWERGKGLSVRVGTTVEYGKFLQFKKPVDGGRPWMSTANREMRSKINQIIGRKIRDKIL